MEIIKDILQLSPEWFALKAGVPSSSDFNKIITTKGDRSDSRKNYLYQLAGEKIIGHRNESYVSYAMKRGIVLEPEARALYSFIKEVDVETVTIVFNESRNQACSPDGLMHKKGLEIKCPELHTHVKYLLSGKLPTTYFQQVQGSMYITGFDSWDFMSYYPGIDPLIIEVERDDKFIDKLTEEMESFLYDLAITTRKLKEIQG